MTDTPTRQDKKAVAIDARRLRETRLARRLMPQLDPRSGLLPTDKWIIATAWDMCRTVPALRREAKTAALMAATVAASGVTVVFSGLMMASMTTLGLTVGGLGLVVAVGVGSMGALMLRRQMQHVRKNHMTMIKAEVAVRYMRYQAQKLKDAMTQAVKPAPTPAPAPATPAPTAAPQQSTTSVETQVDKSPKSKTQRVKTGLKAAGAAFRVARNVAAKAQQAAAEAKKKSNDSDQPRKDGRDQGRPPAP